MDKQVTDQFSGDGYTMPDAFFSGERPENFKPAPEPKPLSDCGRDFLKRILEDIEK